MTNTNDYRRLVPVGERFTGPRSAWTQCEIEQLQAEMLQGLSLKTIATRHDRSEGAIRSQLKHMRNGKIPQIWEVSPERQGVPWLQEEYDAARTEYENGMTIEQIAEKHHRSNEAIRKKLITQGVIEK